MAGFASQAALRSHYEDLIDETENDLTEKLSSAVSWFKQVVLSLLTRELNVFLFCTITERLENVAQCLIDVRWWEGGLSAVASGGNCVIDCDQILTQN